MTDWLQTVYNSVWLLGLATLVATLNLTHWLAIQDRGSLRQYLAEPGARLGMAIGFILFSLGLALTIHPWWYKIGWLAVLALATWGGVMAWRDRQSATQ
jgi:hypothetical protein